MNGLFLIFALFCVLLNCYSRSGPFKRDGIVNPAAHYQRFRLNEFPQSHPFFQWYYFYFSDFDTKMHYALTLAYTSTASYVTFALIGAPRMNEKYSYIKYEKFPPNAFSFSTPFHVSISNVTDLHSMDGDSGTVLRLSGALLSNEPYFFDGNAFSQSAIVRYNLTLYRQHGWYGQEEFETG